MSHHHSLKNGTAFVPSDAPPRRLVNIVNFIRYDEPRDPQLDLLEPVARQMELLRESGLPCTWLLQFDALTAGPYVEFLKENRPENHEVGLWFEINRMHCDAAGVPFHGRDGLNWDYHAQASLSVGYSPEERIRLVDTAVRRFADTFGHLPCVVAAWYIDAYSLSWFSVKYEISAFAICRDQYGTDGYTLWGAPWAGAYFPSRNNTMIPAQTPGMQIDTPVFRLLGSDPIHQYDLNLGESSQSVLTLEPVYPEGGGNADWVRRYLDHLCYSPAMAFTYAQAGQENSFGWPLMAKGYELQIEEFVRRRASGLLEFETLGTTGKWFRGRYRSTPAQIVVALDDTLGGDRRSIWYQSSHYRINLIIEGDRLFLRDWHFFDENYRETWLAETCDTHEARFDALPLLDGFGWSTSDTRALGSWFRLKNHDSATAQEIVLAGNPVVENDGSTMSLRFPLQDDSSLLLLFTETAWRATLLPRLGDTFPSSSTNSDDKQDALQFSLRWAEGARTAFAGITPNACEARFEHRAFPYRLQTLGASLHAVANGFDARTINNACFEFSVRHVAQGTPSNIK